MRSVEQGSRPWFLIFTGIVVHLILCYSIIDIHFQTPVVQGIKPVRPDVPALAKRVVLIVADGAAPSSPPRCATFARGATCAHTQLSTVAIRARLFPWLCARQARCSQAYTAQAAATAPPATAAVIGLLPTQERAIAHTPK